MIVQFRGRKTSSKFLLLVILVGHMIENKEMSSVDVGKYHTRMYLLSSNKWLSDMLICM